MANELAIRRGSKVRYVKTHYNIWGNPTGTTDEVVNIVDNPRDLETGRYCSPRDWHASVKVRNEQGKIYEVDCDDLEVYNTIWDLTHDELKELRGQVVLGSCYTGDYANKFGIDPKQVLDFCEGYGGEIGWDEDADTPEAFADYCEGVERYDEAA